MPSVSTATNSPVSAMEPSMPNMNDSWPVVQDQRITYKVKSPRIVRALSAVRLVPKAIARSVVKVDMGVQVDSQDTRELEALRKRCAEQDQLIRAKNVHVETMTQQVIITQSLLDFTQDQLIGLLAEYDELQAKFTSQRAALEAVTARASDYQTVHLENLALQQSLTEQLAAVMRSEEEAKEKNQSLVQQLQDSCDSHEQMVVQLDQVASKIESMACEVEHLNTEIIDLHVENDILRKENGSLVSHCKADTTTSIKESEEYPAQILSDFASNILNMTKESHERLQAFAHENTDDMKIFVNDFKWLWMGSKQMKLIDQVQLLSHTIASQDLTLAEMGIMLLFYHRGLLKQCTKIMAFS